MPSLHRASQLDPKVKDALESLLGRSLDNEEAVSVRTYRIKKGPDDATRAAAYEDLRQRVAQTAERARGVPDPEVDAAIDEAAHFVRHNPE